jgi:hypothetical protein
MVWSAQNLNRNCKYLVERLDQYLDDATRAVCNTTLAKTKVSYTPFPAWYNFKTKPYIKQTEALDRCFNLRRFALFMGMGSGKTKTAIDVFSAHFMNNRIDCWVVVAPVNIKSTWAKKQIPIHMPIDVPVYVLPEGNKAKAQKMVDQVKKEERFVLIVGTESMSSGIKTGTAYESVRECIIGRRVGVTIDESHLVKGHDSIRSKNVKHLCDGVEVACIMTGTPMSQGPMDLYMQFDILDPNILGFGDFYSFRARYAVMGGYENKQVVGYENIGELMDLISPFVYQCTKEEVVDLPPKVFNTVFVKMSPEQLKAYQQIDKEMVLRIPKTEADIEVFVEHAMTKYGILQQITGGFINYDDVAGVETIKKVRKSEILVDPIKNPKIVELIRIANENPDKLIVVWAKYRTEILMIKQALELTYGRGVCSEYHGGIPKEERDNEERRFLNKESRFMLSNQQTGGAGTTWTESEITFYYSNGFRMLDREQSEDRNHRIGTVNKVMYYDVLSEDTIDEQILDAIELKKDLAKFVRDGIRARLLTSE